jgi:hypothetical protein
MPIRREYRWFYPIDWPQLSAAMRFGRAKGHASFIVARTTVGISPRGWSVVERGGVHMAER